MCRCIVKSLDAWALSSAVGSNGLFYCCLAHMSQLENTQSPKKKLENTQALTERRQAAAEVGPLDQVPRGRR
jgi:exosome complex RNA-binding protein Rrp42 (RNase PH superfamily)